MFQNRPVLAENNNDTKMQVIEAKISGNLDRVKTSIDKLIEKCTKEERYFLIFLCIPFVSLVEKYFLVFGTRAFSVPFISLAKKYLSRQQVTLDWDIPFTEHSARQVEWLRGP